MGNQNINLLSKDWKSVRLKEISESIQYGYTESSSKEIVGPKFLRITDIQENKVDWEDVPYCKINNAIKNKYLLRSGDLVFARTGATVGKSFLIKGNIPEAVFASYLIRVRGNDEINDKYLSYFFHSTSYWAQITEGQVGIGQPNVNGSKLGQLVIPLPPKSTQQTIVSKIEELFSELDKGIESLLTAQQQLKTYRQSVLKWAFEGRLTNENVKDCRLPEGWKEVRLGDVSQSSLGKMLDQQKNRGVLRPYLRNINVRWNKFNLDNLIEMRFEEKESERYEIEKGDLIICEGGEPGRAAIWKGQYPNMKIQKALHRVRFEKSSSPEYFLHYLTFMSMTKSLDQYFTGTTIKHLTGQSLKRIPYPFPPIKTQHEIVNAIEQRLSIAEKMEQGITHSLQQSEALRQSILKMAFEGRLVNE